MKTVGINASAEREMVTETSLPQRQWLQPLPLLLVFLVVQAIAWTVVPPLVFSALHPNTLEVAMWARDWYLVNYKHPALPSWLLGGGYFVFGNELWVPYFLSELCVAGTYVSVFLLGRDILGARRALFAALLLPSIWFLTILALRYNHNIVQMVFWAAFCLGLWRASSTERMNWWAFTAFVAACGVYSKFSMLMIGAFGAAWLLMDPVARTRLRGRALYLGFGLFLLLLVPLAVGLALDHFGAVQWISQESGDRGLTTKHFLQHLIRTFVLMLAAILVGLAASLVPPRVVRSGVAADGSQTIERRGLVYLAVMGLGPLALMAIMSIFMRMRPEWLAPMYSLAGLPLVGIAAARWPRLGRLTQAGLRHAGLALLLSLAILAGQARDPVMDRIRGKGLEKPAYPAAEMSERFDKIWLEKVGTPLKIVAGDNWTAGVVGLFSTGSPSLFSYLDNTHSPSMTDERIAKEGMLVLWSPHSTWQPTADLLAKYPQGEEIFPWSPNPKSKPVVVDYLIVPPAN